MNSGRLTPATVIWGSARVTVWSPTFSRGFPVMRALTFCPSTVVVVVISDPAVPDVGQRDTGQGLEHAVVDSGGSLGVADGHGVEPVLGGHIAQPQIDVGDDQRLVAARAHLLGGDPYRRERACGHLRQERRALDVHSGRLGGGELVLQVRHRDPLHLAFGVSVHHVQPGAEQRKHHQQDDDPPPGAAAGPRSGPAHLSQCPARTRCPPSAQAGRPPPGPRRSPRA